MPERLKAILDKITAWWKKFNTKQRSVLISIVAVVIVALVILGVVISRYAQPEEIVTQEELKTMLVKSLDNLTEKERRVIELYYYEDLTLKEISNILEVSESRVSQLHTKGLIKMRKVMGPYMNILTNA